MKFKLGLKNQLKKKPQIQPKSKKKVWVEEDFIDKPIETKVITIKDITSNKKKELEKEYKEEFISVPSYENLYLLSKSGKLYSLKKERMMKIQNDGYVCLNRDCSRETIKINKLIIRTFGIFIFKGKRLLISKFKKC